MKGSDAALIFRSLPYAMARKQNELQLLQLKAEAAEAAAAHREADGHHDKQDRGRGIRWRAAHRGHKRGAS